MIAKPLEALPDWLEALKAKGPFKCICGCKIDLPGVCDECSRRLEREQTQRPLHALAATLPLRFRGVAFDNESTNWIAPGLIGQAKRAADLVCSGAVDTVLLLGRKGTGKTRMAVSMLRHIAGAGSSASWRCHYVAAMELAAARGEYGARSHEATEAIGASCLLLDDLGQEQDTDQIRMREVIHARHDLMRPTIITSGFADRVLMARYGDGMDRRLFERSAVIETGGL